MYTEHGNKNNLIIQINISYSNYPNSGAILMQKVTGKHSSVCFLLLVLGQGGQWLWFTSNGLTQKHQLTVSIPGTALSSLVFHPLAQCTALGTGVICETSSKIPQWKALFSCILPTVTENWEFTGIEDLLWVRQLIAFPTKTSAAQRHNCYSPFPLGPGKGPSYLALFLKTQQLAMRKGIKGILT